jgi:hypothetical protein
MDVVNAVGLRLDVVCVHVRSDEGLADRFLDLWICAIMW